MWADVSGIYTDLCIFKSNQVRPVDSLHLIYDAGDTNELDLLVVLFVCFGKQPESP